MSKAAAAAAAAAVVAVVLGSLMAGNVTDRAQASTGSTTCITKVVGERDRPAFLVLRKGSASLCRDLRSKLLYGRVVPLRAYTPHGGETFVEELIASFWYKRHRLDIYAYYKYEAWKTVRQLFGQPGVTEWDCTSADPHATAQCEAVKRSWRG